MKRSMLFILLFVFFLIGCSTEVTNQSFENQFVSFDYPSNWDVVEYDVGQGNQEIFLSTHTDATHLYDVDSKFDGVTMNIARRSAEDGERISEQSSLELLEQLAIETQITENFLPTNEVTRFESGEMVILQYKKVTDFGKFSPEWEGVEFQIELAILFDQKNQQNIIVYAVDSGKNGSADIDPIILSLQPPK